MGLPSSLLSALCSSSCNDPASPMMYLQSNARVVTVLVIRSASLSFVVVFHVNTSCLLKRPLTARSVQSDGPVQLTPNLHCLARADFWPCLFGLLPASTLSLEPFSLPLLVSSCPKPDLGTLLLALETETMNPTSSNTCQNKSFPNQRPKSASVAFHEASALTFVPMQNAHANPGTECERDRL